MSSSRRYPHEPWVDRAHTAGRDRTIRELDCDLDELSVPDEAAADIETSDGDLDRDLEAAQLFEDHLTSLGIGDKRLLQPPRGGRSHAHALTAIAVGLAVALALLMHSLVQGAAPGPDAAEVAAPRAPLASVDAAGAASPAARSRHAMLRAGRAHRSDRARRLAVHPPAPVPAAPGGDAVGASQRPGGTVQGRGSTAEFRFER